MSLAGVLFLLVLLAGIAMSNQADPMGSSQNRSHPSCLLSAFLSEESFSPKNTLIGEMQKERKEMRKTRK